MLTSSATAVEQDHISSALTREQALRHSRAGVGQWVLLQAGVLVPTTADWT